MKSLISRVLIVFLMGGCASADLQPAHNPHAKKKNNTPVLPANGNSKPVAPTPTKANTQTPKPHPEPIKKSVKELKPAPVLETKLLPPTRINRKDGSIMVHVPAGEYLVPLDPPGQHRLTDNSRGLAKKLLPGFYMDLTEVKVKQFKLFKPQYDETVHTGGDDCPECPAMGIDWTSARNYCMWAGKRLPTEEEWEAAARGQTQRLVPWEGKSGPKRANLLGEMDGFLGVAPAGSFPLGASPTGALDMAGNVWEWVATPVPNPTGIPKPVSNPEEPDPTLPSSAPSQSFLLKGGSWSSQPLLGAISIRNPVDGTVVNSTFGFRCAKSAN
ncbi:formylglycine-generating enzyme family protein [Nitrospina sp. 32_T5]|uniref:formylglycine-generating enzyme family protein n=1 Tax=unclassified Nitrospina TaxID=2638683 RepID=UPI003F9AE399